MAWTARANSYDTTSDFTNYTKTVRAKFNTETILRYARTWVLLLNDPSITVLNMKVYYDEAGEKGDLLATSTNSYATADITTKDNCLKEVWFKFNDISFDADNYYHFALGGSASSFSTTKHLAWKTSYPYPIYTAGFGQSFGNMPKFPYEICFIGAEL